MPSLDDLADSNYRVKKGPTCSVGLLLSTLDDKTADTLRRAMANPHAGGVTISDALREMGHAVAAPAVQRHRRGQCRCTEPK